MQHLVMDEACIDCYDLYQNEKKNGATGGYCGKATERQLAELLYQKRAEKLLSDENCFKVFIVSLIFFSFENEYLDSVVIILQSLCFWR